MWANVYNVEMLQWYGDTVSSFVLCWNFHITDGSFGCSSSCLTFVYKSTFWNNYAFVILIQPRSINELGGGLAHWVSWLASTLVAEELRFDSQPGQEISVFSDVRAVCGVRRYLNPRRSGVFLPRLMWPRIKDAQLTSICNRSVECFVL